MEAIAIALHPLLQAHSTPRNRFSFVLATASLLPRAFEGTASPTLVKKTWIRSDAGMQTLQSGQHSDVVTQRCTQRRWLSQALKTVMAMRAIPMLANPAKLDVSSISLAAHNI